MNVLSEFTRLVDAIAKIVPDAGDQLSAGATPEMILELEEVVGFELPNQLATLLGVCNGQQGSSPIFGAYSFLSIVGIKYVRNVHGPIFVEENKFWMPIGSGEPFELVLDCNPDPEVNRGVFTYEPETHASPPIATSLAEFFSVSTDRVDQGHFRQLLGKVFIVYES